MGYIWEPRKEEFAFVNYDISGDRGWLSHIKPRIFELKGFVPFMISNSGQLICIPGKTRDQNTIILSGSRRTGKSVMMSGLINNYFHSANMMCLHANDSNDETFTWHLRAQKKVEDKYYDFRRRKYLPIVHVLFQSRNLRLPPKSVPRWNVCLPFLDVVDHPEEYLGLEKAASANYLANMRPRFVKELYNVSIRKKKSDWEFVKSIILDELEKSDADAKVVHSIYNSLVTRIGRFVNDGLLDVSSSNPLADTALKIRFAKDSPWMEFNVLSGLLALGAIPILHTNNIKSNKKFFKTYLSNQLEKVKDDMDSHSFFKDKKLMIFMDELQAICHNGRGGENPIVEELVTGGGPIGIGTCYSLQNPSKLPDAIISNSKCFITCQNTRSEAKVLCKEFSVEDRYVDEIVHLRKSYRQCVAYTQEKFAVFDPVENEFYYDSGPYVGEYTMSPSRTLPPKSGIE